MKKICSICLCALLALTETAVFAETFELKSGKVIEGRIVEEGEDYFKINESGRVFKVRKSLLNDETLKKLRAPQDEARASGEAGEEAGAAGETPGESSTESSSAAGDDSVVGWTGWYMTSSYYINQVQRNMLELERISQESIMKFAVAYQAQDRQKAFNYMQQYRGQIQELIDTFNETVTPPPEFELYHTKILDYQKYVKKIMDAFVLLDRQSLLINRKRALRALIEGFEELKRLCEKHNAPAEYIEPLDASITLYRKYMNM